MLHKRVRTDTFESVGPLLRVTGRQGYESSTDIWISRTMGAKFQQAVADTEDRGWNVYRNESPYTLPHTFRLPNLTGGIDFDMDSFGINNSLENLRIRPAGCKTVYNAYPKTQRKLLPYLIPYRQLVRQDPFQNTAQSATLDASSEMGEVLPTNHWWDPLVNGNFVFSTHANATVAGNANSITNVGFCPREMIQFGTFTQAPAGNPNAFFQPLHAAKPHLIGLLYNPELDSLHFNEQGLVVGTPNIIVRVQTEVLGGAANPNYHFFELAADPQIAERHNDSFSLIFNENGIAGRKTPHQLIIPVVVNQPAAPPLPNQNLYDPEDSAQYELDLITYNAYLLAVAARENAIIAVQETEFRYGVKNGAA